MRLQTTQQRFVLCVVIASLLHGLGFVSFKIHRAHNQPVPSPLDIVLVPPVAPATNKNSAPQKSMQLANSLGGTRVKEGNLKKRTISMTHHQPQDTAYLTRWQTRIEAIGESHMHRQQQQLSGSLRLMVAVNKDGSLREVNLRQSSGSDALDKTAIQIVTKAAPFEPLPDEIASEIDVLEIIRTWQFNGTDRAKS